MNSYHHQIYPDYPYSIRLGEYIENKTKNYWSKYSIIVRGINHSLGSHIQLGVLINAIGGGVYENGSTYFKRHGHGTSFTEKERKDGIQFMFDVFTNDIDKLMKFTIEIKDEFDKEIIKVFKSPTYLQDYIVFERYKLLEDLLKFLIEQCSNKRKIVHCQSFSGAFIPSEPIKKVIDKVIEDGRGHISYERFKSLNGNGKSLLEELIQEKMNEFSELQVPLTEKYNQKYFDYFIRKGDIKSAKYEIEKIKDIEEYISKRDTPYYQTYSVGYQIRIANMLLIVGKSDEYLKIMKMGEKELDRILGDKASRWIPGEQLALINDYVKNGFLLEAALLMRKDYSVYRGVEVDRMAIAKDIAKGFNTITLA